MHTCAYALDGYGVIGLKQIQIYKDLQERQDNYVFGYSYHFRKGGQRR